MKHARIGIFLALLLLAPVFAEAQASFFRPFTSFRVIRTGHFDIIFPSESEPSARILASYADRVYEEMVSILGIEVPFRIPVVLNPHTDLFNGFYSFFPNPHIMLFDTPMDAEWTTFPDTLKGLFIHELAHAISMNTMGPVTRFLHRIFGNWVVPAPFIAPLFAVEGVAVTFESLSGFGRANDPLVRHHFRQSVHEGRFLTPMQVSGLYDLPRQVFFHEYGGLFSAWLQQNHGMEKYVGLWQAMGRGVPRFSFSVYRSGFYAIFRDVYGISFTDAWTAFRASFALEGIEENRDEVFPRRYRFFSERNSFISRLAAAGDSVFVLDGRGGRVHVYDTHRGTTRRFGVGVIGAYDLDVSADGATVLVSGYRFVGDRIEAIVVEYRTDTGRRTGRSFRGLYRARYFRDGVIGIRSQRHNTVMVFESFGGESRVLFRGTPGLLFSGPQAVDGDRIAFVAARDGARELWLFDYATGELFRIENYCDGNELWTHMRGLGVSGGKLLFSHNADDRLYKLAAIDLGTMRAVFSERDFSGGVFNPVYVSGAIYYRGAFSSRDRLLRFPENPGALSGRHSDLKLVPLDIVGFAEVSGAGPYPETGTGVRANAWADPPDSETAVWRTTRYFGIRHMNPFRFWFPMPLVRVRDTGDELYLALDGGGLFSLMADPTQRNFVQLAAFADMRYRMAMVQNFSWQNTYLGFPLTASFSDTVVQIGDELFRDTRIGLTGGQTWSMGRWAVGLSLGGVYIRIADYDGGASAYSWAETGSLVAVFPAIAFSNRRRMSHELFGTGVSMNFVGASLADNFEPYVAGMFQATAESRFPVSLTLFGAYDERGMSLHGVSRRFGQPVFAAFAPTEFRHPVGLSLNWLGGAEMALGLFSLEIQDHLSHLYFNRIFGTLAVRTAVYDCGGHPHAEGFAIPGLLPDGDIRIVQSLVFRLGTVTSFRFGSFPFFFEPSIWAAWKFSNTITGEGFPWNVGLGFNMRL